MALTDKLAAIANAIRAKTGKADKMVLDDMPDEIAGIETGGSGEWSTVGIATGVEPTGELVLDGITCVGYAFANNTAITKAVVTNCKIGERLFIDCSSLESVDLSGTLSVAGYI